MRVEILDVQSCHCACWLTTEKLMISRNRQSLQIIVKGLAVSILHSNSYISEIIPMGRVNSLSLSLSHTHIHTHARTHARTHVFTHTRTYARTHARTCSHTHARTHARTHTHTQAQRHTEKQSNRTDVNIKTYTPSTHVF